MFYLEFRDYATKNVIANGAQATPWALPGVGDEVAVGLKVYVVVSRLFTFAKSAGAHPQPLRQDQWCEVYVKPYEKTEEVIR